MVIKMCHLSLVIDDDAVIVEDCPSACAVSNILTGIAIMGTSLKEAHKSHLRP